MAGNTFIVFVSTCSATVKIALMLRCLGNYIYTDGLKYNRCFYAGGTYYGFPIILLFIRKTLQNFVSIYLSNFLSIIYQFKIIIYIGFTAIPMSGQMSQNKRLASLRNFKEIFISSYLYVKKISQIFYLHT